MAHSGPTSCFLAYPSQPLSLAETIEAAIPLLERTGYARPLGWKALHISGRIVIGEICKAIAESDLFVAEITHLNPNVLFELGYAVAKNKPVWLLLDPSYAHAQADYRQVSVLTTIGYAPYNNAQAILDRFLADQPYNDLGDTLFGKVVEPVVASTPRQSSVVYLRSPVETEASSRLTSLLLASPLSILTDDPAEVPIQPLAWYAQNVFHASAVIAHLIDEARGQAVAVQNAKYAFVAGFAYGLGKPILMLAHSPFSPHFDYQDLLFVHHTATECVDAAKKWLAPTEAAHAEDRELHRLGRTSIQAAAALQRIHLGDYIAENEQQDLLDYFIVTAPYIEAIRASQSRLYVGRKGTGKSANLYKMADDLGRNKSNHVCVIKPVDYDLEGVLRLLRLSIPLSEQGYLMESLWKYLIYTQIACSCYDGLRSRPIHVPMTPTENEFLRFVDSHRDSLFADFTLRLEAAITGLCNIDFGTMAAPIRARVSEVLHGKVLADLRARLGHLLEGKKKVCVLVDNLDKAWRLTGDLPQLAEFIFGLLSVSRAITDEFHRIGPSWRAVNVAILVFLRSDIFSYIASHAREADKLVYSAVDWSDEGLLLRLIEERINASLDKPLPSEEIWRRYFVPTVRKVPTGSYLVSRIIRRPRDMIYICKAAFAHAVNRAHVRVEEGDIQLAVKEYSSYAFLTLVSEIRPHLPAIEEILTEFAGFPPIVARSDIEKATVNAGLDAASVDLLIDLLADSLFLGPEVEIGEFQFLYDYPRRDVAKARARSTTQSTAYQRYLINAPFYSYLDIAPA